MIYTSSEDVFALSVISRSEKKAQTIINNLQGEARTMGKAIAKGKKSHGQNGKGRSAKKN
jgi:hypothetical protein